MTGRWGWGQTQPVGTSALSSNQVNLRRAAVTKIWDRSVARGELDANVDPEVALDLIFEGGRVPDGDWARGVDPG